MKRKNFPNRLKARRDEAAIRNDAYSKLSPAEKLARLDRLTGGDQSKSVRQRKKLAKVK